jgi:murein DD-endopeptidase MepM/ murein hydrolase activator NlpD
VSTPAILLSLVILATGPGWPVDDPEVVSGFRPPDSAWGAGHRGIDLAAATGDPVRTMTDGTVAFVGHVAGKSVVTLRLDGPTGWRSTYEPVLGTLPPGSRVRAGDRIGTLAISGGHCGGSRGCLHVGLRDATGYLDPIRLLGHRGAVLKPW